MGNTRNVTYLLQDMGDVYVDGMTTTYPPRVRGRMIMIGNTANDPRYNVVIYMRDNLTRECVFA